MFPLVRCLEHETAFSHHPSVIRVSEVHSQQGLPCSGILDDPSASGCVRVKDDAEVAYNPDMILIWRRHTEELIAEGKKAFLAGVRSQEAGASERGKGDEVSETKRARYVTPRLLRVQETAKAD